MYNFTKKLFKSTNFSQHISFCKYWTHYYDSLYKFRGKCLYFKYKLL